MQSLVKGHLVMSLLASEELAFETSVQLAYDPADPFAVTLTFHLPGDAPVSWVFGRELLLDGVSRPAGDGDVRIEPIPGPDDSGGDVRITLRSPEGDALLRSPAVPLIAFLGRTDRVLPMGQEHADEELERQLAEILAGACGDGTEAGGDAAGNGGAGGGGAGGGTGLGTATTEPGADSGTELDTE